MWLPRENADKIRRVFFRAVSHDTALFLCFLSQSNIFIMYLGKEVCGISGTFRGLGKGVMLDGTN